MNKYHKNFSGFTVVEVLLVIITLAIVGVAGYFVAKHVDTKKAPAATITKTTPANPAKPATPTQPASPYAGWKTFVLPVEKLSFMYPPDWTVSNTATTATQDDTTLTSADGSTLEIEDGVSNGGDPRQLDSGSPVPINYIGQADDLVFGWARVPNPNGPSSYSSTQVQSALLLTNPSDQYSLPLDKNAVGPNDTTGAVNAKYIQISYDFKSPMTSAQAQTNLNFSNAKFIIKSMHY